MARRVVEELGPESAVKLAIQLGIRPPFAGDFRPINQTTTIGTADPESGRGREPWPPIGTGLRRGPRSVLDGSVPCRVAPAPSRPTG